MIPLGSLITVQEINGPLLLTRYNMYPAVTINGSTAPKRSTGEAINVMQELADSELPGTMSYEWTEITYLQLQSGATAMLIFALSVVGVFLVLAALYESWTLPLAVILVVPMCLLGSLTGVALSQSDINIFTQIGFVVLVGLASKNAILIVEFAKLKRDAGVPRRQAILEACQLRLRPILMTSFAFIFGVIPLMLSTGAGAEMRRVLGTAVFSGMLGVTLFGIFLTPVFFYVIDWLGEQALFGSARTRRAAQAAAWAFGSLAVLLVEVLLVVAWWDEVLSLAGLVVMTLGLFSVVILVMLAHRVGRGQPQTGTLPLMNLWPQRWRRNGRELSRNGDSSADEVIAAQKQ
jgi:multidrug efflux pump